MKLVLAGMPSREAAALEIFVGMTLKGWTSQAVKARAGSPLPLADAYVVDLAGFGLANWSAHGEAELLTLVKGCHALLLTPSYNHSWDNKTRGRDGQFIGLLPKPYDSEAMRVALGRLCGGQDAAGASQATPEPRQPARQTALASQAASQLAPPPRARPPAAAPLPPRFGSLMELNTMFPDLGQYRLLSRLLDALATGRPHELRLTLRHSIVMHPGEGWVAHNAQPGMLERLAEGDNAVEAVSVRELSDAEALERVSRIDSQRSGLDAFLWRLADTSLGEQTPKPQRDAQLRLRGIPDFTRIPGAGNLYLQLSAICVRLPQTLASLRAALPRQDPRVLTRFMLLTAISGAGDLSLVEAGRPARPAARPAAKPARPQAGFLRAFLKKLF